LIILNLFQQADFLIVTGNLEQYITISENSLRLDQLLKEKSPLYRSTIFHLVDAYIYKRGNEDSVRELLTELGESPIYKLETVFLYGKTLNFTDPEKTDIQFVLDRFNAATVLEAAEKAVEETQGSEEQNAFFLVVNEVAGALSNYGYSKDAQRYYSRAISII
jgi:hypothetical protein